MNPIFKTQEEKKQFIATLHALAARIFLRALESDDEDNVEELEELATACQKATDIKFLDL